jgi:acyl transferase domain-containing protein
MVGISNVHWSSLRLENPGALTGTAISGAICANRISFVHGLTGASLAVDTACSSALVAIDVALSTFRNSSCQMALCASCEILLSLTTIIIRSAAHMLAHTGRCFTFDASANGYSRAEGCAGLVLCTERPPTAVHIIGSAVNQDGRTATLTAPNGPSQVAVIRAACR